MAAPVPASARPRWPGECSCPRGDEPAHDRHHTGGQPTASPHSKRESPGRWPRHADRAPPWAWTGGNGEHPARTTDHHGNGPPPDGGRCPTGGAGPLPARPGRANSPDGAPGPLPVSGQPGAASALREAVLPAEEGADNVGIWRVSLGHRAAELRGLAEGRSPHRVNTACVHRKCTKAPNQTPRFFPCLRGHARSVSPRARHVRRWPGHSPAASSAVVLRCRCPLPSSPPRPRLAAS